MKIELDNGKYTYLFDEKSGVQKALRNGEEWRDLTGDNLVYWMACRIVELEEDLENVYEYLNESPVGTEGLEAWLEENVDE